MGNYLVIYILLFFFFFKQKTAYEIYQCDWSSDVCSSDLSAHAKHCGAGSSGIAIDPFGDVLPCVEWRQPIGNLHERNIKSIWSAEAEWCGVRQTTQEVKKQLNQDFGESSHLLGFCPGIARSLNNDPHYIYPSAREQCLIYQSLNKSRQAD